MLRIEPRWGRHQTLGDCGICPRAQGAGAEAQGWCPEQSTIGSMSKAELLRYWERTSQSEVCGGCGVDVMAPVGERMTQLHGGGWELHGGVVRPRGLSQINSVNQQGPLGN